MKNLCKQNVIIVGAGVAGKMVCDEILKHLEINYSIVGFLDDDKKKINTKYSKYHHIQLIS